MFFLFQIRILKSFEFVEIGGCYNMLIIHIGARCLSSPSPAFPANNPTVANLMMVKDVQGTTIVSFLGP